ncbi:MAG TPA: LysM domain-containing protein, partial [Symbiobacteriaceae bacterium]|nr:LysM domain-containing protein [Symbiobacteriaceae bacterium]
MPRKPLILAVVALCTLLGIAADLGYRAYTRPQFAVLVEGHLLGALRNPNEAQGALDTVLGQIPQEMRSYVNLEDKMTVRTLQEEERQQALTDATTIQQALVQTIPALSFATAITVDGLDIVAVASVEQAKQVKETILDEYRSTVLRDVSVVEQLAFQEKIDWHPKVVPNERVRTVEEAIRILKYGTDRLVVHEVQSGDTGWDIARTYNISTEQLAKANPDTNLELLQIGQSLNVTYREPYVHTLSVSKKVVEEWIPFTESIEPDSTLWPWQYRVIT